MAYYVAVLTACSLVSFLYKKKSLALFLASIILVLFAGTRLDIDNDYSMYKFLFTTNFKSLKEFDSMKVSVEYCVFLVNRVGKLLFTFNREVAAFGFMTFAFLGVTTKMIAIRKYSVNIILSVILYTTYLFLMQEMTTIRAGVASGIFLLALKFLVDKKYLYYFLFISLSFLFHNSSILFVLAALMIFLDLKIKYYYYALAVSFIVIITNQNIVRLLFLDAIFPRVATYLEILEWSKEEKLNIFNFKIIISILFFILIALNYKKFENDRWFEVLFRINIISLILFFALSNTAAVFSSRSFELLSVVQILLYPMLLKVVNQKFAVFVWFIIILTSVVQLYYLVEIADIYKTYESWMF